MESEQWQLVGLFGYTSARLSYNDARRRAHEALAEDIGKWTLPVSYKLTQELIR